MQRERTSPAWTLTAVTKGRRRATLKTDGGWAARRCGGIQGGLDEVASMPRSPQWRHSEASKKCGRCAECPPAPGCQPYCSPSCQWAHWRIEHREVYPPAGWRGDSPGPSRKVCGERGSFMRHIALTHLHVTLPSGKVFSLSRPSAVAWLCSPRTPAFYQGQNSQGLDTNYAQVR